MTAPDRAEMHGRRPRSVEVEFVGGHLDGATVGLLADATGRPPGELRTLSHPSMLPARWGAEDSAGPPSADPLPVVCYRREPVVVGGLLLGWRMVATR